MMELIYCRATEDFTACGAALGRHFLGRGVAGFILDGKVSGMLSHYAAGKEAAFSTRARGAPPLTTWPLPEKVILG